MAWLEQRVLWVAYSGGVDSHVLLHVLAHLRSQHDFTLRAVHIHHGLQPKAHAWQQHCQAICQSLQIELTVHALNLSALQGNIEAQARQWRYHYFASLLQPGDYLMTGHHQDDQAETVLLQLLRGAGPKGLSAMPASSPLGKGILLRPLLEISHQELLAYARQYHLTWIEDESNQDVRFSRNFIRQQVMPLLKQRWPSVATTLTRSAQHCAEVETLLDDTIAPLLQSCVLSADALSITQLKNLHAVQQKHVIRSWLSHHGLSLPNELKLKNIIHVFLNAAIDKNPSVTWGQVVLRRYQEALILSRLPRAHDPRQIFAWDIRAVLPITSLALTLHAKTIVGAGIKILAQQPVEIRFRRGGEHLYLAQRQGRRSLKKCFQQWKVAAWQRDRVPLLYIDNQLAAVIGYAIAQDFTVASDEVGVEIIAVADE